MRGCGKSRPVECSKFTIELCVEELEGLRRALGLDVIHLFGHSLGGAVALAYAVKHQETLASLIVCSGFASTPRLARAMAQLKSELPLELRLAVGSSEEAGDYTDPKYRAAIRELVRRHYSRGLKGDEKEHNHTLEHMNRVLYRSGWGPNDFVITGTMKDWDITKSLHQLRVPCLITVGKYDEIPLALAEDMHKEIAGSRLVVFGSSSHLAMWEESENFLKTLADFLLSVPRE
jgi:proline iminopeptidase